MRNAGQVAFGTAALLGVTAALIVFTWRDRRQAVLGLASPVQRVVPNEVGAVALAREPEVEVVPETDEAEMLAVPVEAEVKVAEPVEAEVKVAEPVEAEVKVAEPAPARPLADLTGIFADLMPNTEAIVDLRDSTVEGEAEVEPSRAFVIVGREETVDPTVSAEADVDLRDNEVVDVTDYWTEPVVDVNDDMFPADVAAQHRRFRR